MRMKTPFALIVPIFAIFATNSSLRAEPIGPEAVSAAWRDISALNPTKPETFVPSVFARLSSVSNGFDSGYDVDLERDARLKDILAASLTNALIRTVPASTVLEWAPRDALQLEFGRLFSKVAAGLVAAGKVDKVSASFRIKKSSLSPAMKRRLESEVLFLKLKRAWPGDSSEFQIIGGAILNVAASSDDPRERKAMVSRLARTIALLPDSANRFENALPAAAWIEEFREQAMEACISDGSVSDSFVFWYRVASLRGQFTVLEKQTSGMFVEMNRVLDESGKTARAERIPIFAKTFGECRRWLLNNIEDGKGAAVSLRDYPHSILVLVAKDIASLGRLSDDESAQLLARLDAQTSRLKGDRGDFWNREMERRRNGQPTGLVITHETLPGYDPAGTPLPGTIEAYELTQAIQSELDRYHLEAGVFVQPSYMKPSETNRLSFLLFTPKGSASGKVPLLLFLPGIGEIGSDLAKQFRQRGIFAKVTSPDFQKRHPCYLLVISPPDGTTTLASGSPNVATPMQHAIRDCLLAVARSRKRPPVDADRIYATGLSFGGSGAYALSFAYPDLFSAAAPVASMVFAPARLPDNANCSYYHLYNEGDYRDHGVDMSRLDAFGDKVRKLGGDFRVGTFPNEGHNAWDAAWKEDAMWDWMFSKRRGANGAATRPIGRVSDPTRSVGGGEENHAENAESAEIRPPAVTASKPGRDARTGPERALDGLDGTAYVSASPVAAGDWVQVEWSAPVQGRIEVRTGLPDGTLRLSKGRVEVSVDGRVWSRTGTVSQKTGVCDFGQRTGIRFLRLLPEPRLPEPLAVREIAVKP